MWYDVNGIFVSFAGTVLKSEDSQINFFIYLTV